MKLSELKHFTAFIDVLFDFFKENNITSCLYQLDDFDAMKKKLHDADVHEQTYLGNFRQFNISLRLCADECEDAVYYFLFSDRNPGNEGQSGLVNQLLIEAWGNEYRIMIEIIDNKYPPFVRDFLNASGQLRIAYISGDDELATIDENEIMSMGDLMNFLQKNNVRKDVKWIEVD
ncbi:MAG: hypothetical protein KA369_05850 [Spirochaetes bacterium]|nr:hypothetical protein [Spirochaetota bacterium]